MGMAGSRASQVVRALIKAVTEASAQVTVVSTERERKQVKEF